LAGAGFNEHIGEANAGPVYVDVTGTRQWQWGDFDRALELVLDQTKAGGLDWIYYDAIGLRVWIQPGTEKTDYPLPVEDTSSIAIDPTRQVNVYNKVINVEPLWQWNRRLQGNGVGVAVVDSGVERTGDLAHLKVIDMNFNPGFHDSQDRFGHGTFVAGVIAGSGNSSGGIHVGVAPRSRLLNIRVSDDSGRATASDVVAGLQWVYENAARYNIRVVNMSLNSSVAASYLTDPLCAAAEMLWLRGIVVVVSAGNNGTATLYPPANDPFVITVGATDDKGTAGMTDDTMASFSGYGVTELGSAKPDLVAPGRNIVAYLPYNKTLRMPNEHPNNRVTDSYFRMSGTSVSAPMVTGAVALLLQDEPYLTPNQVKFRLMSTANKNWPGYDSQRSGAGYVDAYAAVNGWTFDNANNGLPVSKILWDSLAGTAWSSVNWNSVNWNSVNWNSVNWNSVNWNSVNWNSVNWNSVNWNSVNWNSDYWETMSAADASEIPAVARLFELLEEQPGATPEVPGKVYLPSVNR
jgi:serine protease AprX